MLCSGLLSDQHPFVQCFYVRIKLVSYCIICVSVGYSAQYDEIKHFSLAALPNAQIVGYRDQRSEVFSAAGLVGDVVKATVNQD